MVKPLDLGKETERRCDPSFMSAWQVVAVQMLIVQDKINEMIEELNGRV